MPVFELLTADGDAICSFVFASCFDTGQHCLSHTASFDQSTCISYLPLRPPPGEAGVLPHEHPHAAPMHLPLQGERAVGGLLASISHSILMLSVKCWGTVQCGVAEADKSS